MSVLVRSEILGLAVNPLTVQSRYSPHNTGSLPQPIQIHLFSKLKTFYEHFIAVLESTLNFEYFEKNFQPHSSSISENIHSEKRGYLNA